MNRTFKTALNISLGLHMAVIGLVWVFSPRLPPMEDRVYVELVPPGMMDMPTRSMPESEPLPEKRTDPEPEKRVEPEPEPEPERRVEPKPEPKPEPPPQPKPEPRPKAKSEPKPEPKPEPEKRDIRPVPREVKPAAVEKREIRPADVKSVTERRVITRPPLNTSPEVKRNQTNQSLRSSSQ